MKGLDLARAYWERYGLPMMERDFPRLLPIVAAGLCGAGSECFGFDDEISRDHDFEPGFCLFLPGEDKISRREEFLLERAYAKLPEEFMGVRRSRLSPVGGNRRGPIRAADFWTEKIGSPTGEGSTEGWLFLPEYALAEAVNGEIFRDDSGFFTRVRKSLVMPEDAVKKRLAGQFFLMGQAGQYNFTRCLAHGESGAARLAADVFVRAALSAAHLLARRFTPYYKWAFRSLFALPGGEEIARELEAILGGGEKTAARIEALCQTTAASARQRWPGLPDTAEMEKLAYAINDQISDEATRNAHILTTVKE